MKPETLEALTVFLCDESFLGEERKAAVPALILDALPGLVDTARHAAALEARCAAYEEVLRTGVCPDWEITCPNDSTHQDATWDEDGRYCPDCNDPDIEPRHFVAAANARACAEAGYPLPEERP